MKINKKIENFLFYLTLLLSIFFVNDSLANSIKEYEKGGLRLGKSLLTLMTKDEIMKGYRDISSGDKYKSTLYVPNPFTHPDEIGLYLVIFKRNDKSFRIAGFYLFEQFPNNFEGCMKKQDEYVKINSKLFRLKPVDYGIKKKPSGTGKWRAIIFDYPIPKETSSILCYHFENQPERNNLKMGVLTREFANYISVKQ